MKAIPNPKRAGSVRSVLVRIFLAAALLWGGGQHLYTWNRNKQITSMTMEDYLKKKPDAEWIEIKEVTLDLPKAAAVKKGDKVKSLYIPIIADRGDEGPAHLVLHTESDEYQAVMRELNATPQDKMMMFILANGSRLWPKKDIRGLVEFGISSNDKHRDQLSKLSMKLTPDFVMVKDGDKPDAVLGGVMFGGGVLVLASFLFLGRRTPPAPGVPPPPAFPRA